MRVIKVYIVRHGETDANANRIIQGHMNTQLNGIGREQAAIVGAALKRVPFTHAFTSDLMRTEDTAKAIVAYHPNVSLVATTQLRERCMGNLEGVQVLERSKRPPNDSTVETSQSLLNRLSSWWEANVFNLMTDPGAPPFCCVLIVSHGASIHMMMNMLYTMRFVPPPPERDFKQAGVLNTSVTEIEMGWLPPPYRPNRPQWYGRVLGFNDISHMNRKTTVTKENVDVAKN